MPFGTVVFPDGSYTGGVPAVHVESAVGRHYVPPAHTPFELNFGFVIPSEQAERCGCSSGLLDVAVEYRERAAVAVRVRWLTPVSRATASTSQGWLQVSDAFSARMLGTSTPSTTNAAEQKATSVLERIQFPSEEESAFCIFPLYPQMPCCWHASQVSLEPIDSRPVAPETLSRFEVDLDRSSFEDPDLTGSDIQLLRTPRSMKLKGRKGRLGRTIEALLAREAARTAPCSATPAASAGWPRLYVPRAHSSHGFRMGLRALVLGTGCGEAARRVADRSCEPVENVISTYPSFILCAR
jgi:hypothetical protein